MEDVSGITSMLKDLVTGELRTPPETYKDLLCEATSYSRVEQLNLARKATTRPNLEAPEPYRPKEKRSNDYAYDR
ncbi:hypothetical protein L3X38_001764 [Prunus dulcis]|uniref:Uncharacterized protein n=1 Tax=Prunus dulcis TaxID=3755 RepID=A0AAD4ZJB9_PRUDU|nr:hypothetical protein L3X38_001764 [Prunus dulcis]